MANISTYAKLIKPKQFKPDEPVTFRMEFSQDLLGCWATLKIYDYTLTIDGETYSGATQTQYINVSWLDTGWVEFTIPPNTLAVNPTDDSYGFSGKMKAVVEIGTQKDESGNAVSQFTSNEILVDMLIQLPEDFGIINVPLTSSGSVKPFQIRYVPRTSLGTLDANEINSYCVILYDQNYNIVQDSGILYDWENSSVIYKTYTLYGLSDHTKYYVLAKITLNGGYTLTTDYVPLTVEYDEEAEFSPYLSIENEPAEGRIKISVTSPLPYNKIVISRTVVNANNYLQIKESKGVQSVFYDYYALPNTTYTYRVTLYQNETVCATYYGKVTHRINGICIADIYAGYSALAFTQKYPVSKNSRPSILEPMDSKYPYAVINGSLDYDSGSISATFALIKECSPDFSDNSKHSANIRHWLNNGEAKLLKYYNGECWIVSTSNVATEQLESTDILTTTFSWTEIADAKKNENYIKLGMVQNES